VKVPWRWIQEDERTYHETRLHDADGKTLIDVACGHDYPDDITFASPYVRAVTERAPQLEQALIDLLPFIFTPLGPNDWLYGRVQEVRALLAEIDKAREGT
jgi:hypothetical protein